MPDLLAEPGREPNERIVLWSWRTQAVVTVALMAPVVILADGLPGRGRALSGLLQAGILFGILG
ncbi:hypothetical protein [Streptomyces sp. NPDC058394]|uniref:hypothetical protein n=1 Tax=Streptomyces sp. NPDC058394 TaxID=3346477 RepID=UPI003665F46A